MAGLNPTPDQLRRLKDAFRELKAEQDQLLRQAESRTFVHTRVYRQVRDERKCLLIGRKGSGKTALLVGYRYENHEEYLAEAGIDIIADEFPLEPLFHFFYKEVYDKLNKRTATGRNTDLAHFLDPTKVATYAWKQSLTASAVCMAAQHILASDFAGRLADDEKRTLEESLGHVLKLLGATNGKRRVGGEILGPFLVYFFTNFTELIEAAVDQSVGSFAALIAKISGQLNIMAKNNTDEALRRPVLQIRQILDRHSKKVLLTLDRFDDFYDEFQYRQNSDMAIEKRAFLSALLKGLVIAARDLQRDTAHFSWMHMIFTIPMDKFLELQLRERADLESNHVVRLEWTPRELYELVNRRIAAALHLPGKDIPNAWKLLFPFDVANGRLREVKEDSFLYIVRHSLWNPREIHMYLKALFAEMEKGPADEDMFRRVVRTETENIIRREFIGQFIGEFQGLQKVLNKLGNVQLRTVLPYETLCDGLGGLELFDDCRTPDQIAVRLFHMGVIGVRVNARRTDGNIPVITQQKQEIAYRFCFNSDENDPFSPGCEVCIHPMFFEYLNIRHDEPYVVNQLTWEMFA
jgi:superoxide dismutase